VSRAVGAVATAAALAGAGLAAVPAARAADAKVAIGHYRWTPDVVHIDLGERVTWYWVGPDTMHSVTGISANDLGIDSDPGTSVPHHTLGDTFTVTFTQPGTYLFHCKMHPIVRGEVIVSDVPGNPLDNPDPVPPLNIDLMTPHLNSIHLRPARFAAGGTTIHYSLDDRSSIDAEIWHDVHGHRGRYAGWQEMHGHIGFNFTRFAARGPHFRPRPGHYLALLTPTDPDHNVGPTRRISFTIRPRPRPHRAASRRAQGRDRSDRAPSRRDAVRWSPAVAALRAESAGRRLAGWAA
jgi:plastocyanin